jgi:hypothetical protein
MRLSLGLLGKKISQFEIMRMLRKSLALATCILGGAESHAPPSLQNIRFSADAANPLSRSRNWRADGDGCDGLHFMQVSRGGVLNSVTVQMVGSEPW